MRYIISSILLLFLIPIFAIGKTISPLNYGLKQAKTGEARYSVLYQTHEIAKKNGWDVSYKGIGELKLEIPANAKSIPLGSVTDFSGITLVVTNTKKKDFFLFELSQELRAISVPKSMFDTYNFTGIKDLKYGYKLLVVEDKNPWVENRVGYNYGATRKDVLLLKNGKALNKTIATYYNASSDPSCKYVEVTKEQKSISNITLKRTKESTAKTYLVKVQNMNNVLLQNIQIITPVPINMDGDNAIGIYNCSNIIFRHIKFDQPYSFSNTYGYGIKMDNVLNSWFDGIECEANWGIFGNNNINTAHISNSRINRFDTHCYGKDFYFSNCEITQVGLPQSSFMGELEFSTCTFRSAYICSARTEYNAYSPFSITIKDCVINLDCRHRCLINLGNVYATTNTRKELSQKVCPGLSITNTKVILSDDVPFWSLFHVGSDSIENPFDVVGDISIDGLQVEGGMNDLRIFDRPLRSRHNVKINLRGIDLIGKESYFHALAQKKYNYTPTIVFNINKGGNGFYQIKDSKLNYSPLEFPHYNVHFSNCIMGRIRYYNIKHGDVNTRRSYENCVFYLNDIDTDNYTLDDNADYKRCVFKPVDKKKKVVPYSMKKATSEMTFEDCSTDVIELFGPKVSKKNTILKSYKYKFQ